MKKNKNIKSDERGMVAIVVTVFFMMVLTLIVMAFSQSARREQRQSLDNQLQKQAFYAAESGINDTKKKIDEAPSGSLYAQEEKTTCSDSTDKVNLTQDGSISYSCVLYDNEPEDIKFDNVRVEQGEVTSLETASNKLKDVILEWRDASGTGDTDFTDCPLPADRYTFNSAKNIPDKCDAGIIKVVIMPITGQSSREELTSKTFTVFFRPTKNGSSVSGAVAYTAYGPTSSLPSGNAQGQVVSAKCTNSGICTASINGLPLTADKNYMYVRSIDQPNQIKIGGVLDDTTIASFKDAQVMIDVTGKANDVLRRLQVRKPKKPDFDRPPFALEVLDGICKKLETYPNQPTDPYLECFDGSSGTGPRGIE